MCGLKHVPFTLKLVPLQIVRLPRVAVLLLAECLSQAISVGQPPSESRLVNHLLKADYTNALRAITSLYHSALNFGVRFIVLKST